MSEPLHARSEILRMTVIDEILNQLAERLRAATPSGEWATVPDCSDDLVATVYRAAGAEAVAAAVAYGEVIDAGVRAVVVQCGPRDREMTVEAVRDAQRLMIDAVAQSERDLKLRSASSG